MTAKRTDGFHLIKSLCIDADKGNKKSLHADMPYSQQKVFLRVSVDTGAVYRFSYSADGTNFTYVPSAFTAREGRWIGAKVGLFAIAPRGSTSLGFADFAWLRIE